MSEPTLFEELGSEPALRRIIDRFVDRIFDDVMIGFFFQSASRERIKQKEYEFAARHLGAKIEYTGRPLDAAHRKHQIFSGQFMRRTMILRQTLEEFGVAAHIRDHWVNHTLSLMSLITSDRNGSCEPDPSRSDSGKA